MTMLFFHVLNIFQAVCDITNDVDDLLFSEADADDFTVPEEVIECWTNLSE